MYSVVLMAALATGGSAPDCHFFGGCCGCHGGCYGCYGGCYGCSCWGGCYGCYGCYASCYGCYGGYGGYAYSYAAPVAPVVVYASAPVQTVQPAVVPVSTKAKLIVEVPADARLYIDGQMMKSTAARRVFSTPALDQKQSYYYDLKAEVVRDGRTFSDTKRVIVKAGQEIRTTFPKLEHPVVAVSTEATARR